MARRIMLGNRTEDMTNDLSPCHGDDPNTTLANIRQRLAVMCNGTMEISPREGGGTVVKVTIPEANP